jgi:hypothetical protein
VSGIQTGTRSQINSFTEARLRAVIPEVGADFTNMAGAGIITFNTAQRWTEELAFVLLRQAAQGFQVQLSCPGRAPIALDYRVSSDGTVRESGRAGGIDYYELPDGRPQHCSSTRIITCGTLWRSGFTRNSADGVLGRPYWASRCATAYIPRTAMGSSAEG